MTGFVSEQRDTRKEMRELLHLAVPVVLAELGWMGMGVVDTIMVGRLGATAIAAVSLGNILFYPFAICGMGVLLGMDTMVSQAFGAGRRDDCRKTLWHGLYLAAFIVPAVLLLTTLTVAAIGVMNLNSEVLALTAPYFNVMLWSTAPLLLYAAFRRYLQGLGLVQPVMFALVSANLVNLAGNWALIYGELGFPAMGIDGSAWATVVSRVYMAGVLAAYTFHREGRLLLARVYRIWEVARVRQLLTLGLPAAAQIALEIGVFAFATVLAAKLTAVALAAHEIVLNTASVTFMVPFGISSAAAVGVGHAIGREDGAGARRVGYMAIGLGAGFMLLAGFLLYAMPEAILRIYTDDARVIEAAVPLLLVCAWFQLFDGLQSVATGALRGAADTRVPMLTNLVGHWGLGLPLSAWLCFGLGWGVLGLWIGLSAGLIFVGAVLFAAWMRKARELTRVSLRLR